MDVAARAYIVAALEGVDAVVKLENEYDEETVVKALRDLKPDVFTKGGDRCDEQSIPEWGICQETGIRIVTGVGVDKHWSSSNYLRDWEEFRRR